MATVDYLSLVPKSILNQDPTSNFGKLWRMFSTQLDLLLAQILSAYTLFVINSQSGLNLDQIGTLVKQDRLPGESDADYRISLFAAISSSISSGSISDLLDTIEIIKSGDTSKFAFLIENYPANIQIFTNMADLLSDGLKILNETRAAGIGLFLHYITTGLPFVFESDPDGLGFSDVATFFLELDTGDTLILDDGSDFIIVDNNPSENGGQLVEVFS
jgi:hypothetical protein